MTAAQTACKARCSRGVAGRAHGARHTWQRHARLAAPLDGRIMPVSLAGSAESRDRAGVPQSRSRTHVTGRRTRCQAAHPRGRRSGPGRRGGVSGGCAARPAGSAGAPARAWSARLRGHRCRTGAHPVLIFKSVSHRAQPARPARAGPAAPAGTVLVTCCACHGVHAQSLSPEACAL